MILSTGPAKKWNVKGDNEATRSARYQIKLDISQQQPKTLTCRRQTAHSEPTGCYQEALHRDRGAGVTEALLKY